MAAATETTTACAVVYRVTAWRRRIGAAVDPEPAADFGDLLTMMRASSTAEAIAMSHRLAGPSTVRVVTNDVEPGRLTVHMPTGDIALPSMPDVAAFLVMATPVTCTRPQEEATS